MLYRGLHVYCCKRCHILYVCNINETKNFFLIKIDNQKPAGFLLTNADKITLLEVICR